METVINDGDDAMQGLYIAYCNEIDEKNDLRRNCLPWWDQDQYVPTLALGYREFIRTAIRRGSQLYFRKNIIGKGKLFIRDKRRFIEGYDNETEN